MPLRSGEHGVRTFGPVRPRLDAEIAVEKRAVESREKWILPVRPVTAVCGLVLLATDALASEEGLELLPEPGLLGVLLVLFALLVAPLNALLFRPLLRVLDAREEEIAGTRRRAEKLEAEAAEVLARYRQSIRDVREDAERARRQALDATRREGAARSARTRAEAERQIEQARREIADALADARAALRAEADHLAREAAARVLGRPLS